MNGLLRRLTRRRAATADEPPPGTPAASEPVDATVVSQEEGPALSEEERAREEELKRRRRDLPAGLDAERLEQVPGEGSRRGLRGGGALGLGGLPVGDRAVGRGLGVPAGALGQRGAAVGAPARVGAVQLAADRARAADAGLADDGLRRHGQAECRLVRAQLGVDVGQALRLALDDVAVAAMRRAACAVDLVGEAAEVA